MTTKPDNFKNLFDLSGRLAVVTGGAGLLGERHLSALQSAGAVVISLDLRESSNFPSVLADISDTESVISAAREIGTKYGPVDILVNNAALNPTVGELGKTSWSRFEQYPIETWNLEIAVGLTGSLIASQLFGTQMAARGKGVILNICSDLAVIAPDQRLYEVDGLADDAQPVKPVSYSVIKHGLLGLTRYLATYWATSGVRVNALSPGGVEHGQDPLFISKLSERIPLARMAEVDEYEGAVLFCCSDASSYMTGHNLIVDGGRTVW